MNTNKNDVLTPEEAKLVRRIAQTVYDNCGLIFDRCEDVAKAIVEAHLTVERGERSNPNGVMWAAGNRHGVHRWVTPWKRDDE